MSTIKRFVPHSGDGLIANTLNGKERKGWLAAGSQGPPSHKRTRARRRPGYVEPMSPRRASAAR